MKDNKNKIINILKIIIVIILLLIVFGSTFYLFYNQSITAFESDLPAHIASALNTNSQQYTITKPIYRFLYHFTDTYGIVALLSISVVLTIIFTKKALKFYTNDDNDFKLYIYAFILNFVIAIYLPFIHPYLNAGVQEGSMWHNSTYTLMKCLAIPIMLLFFKIFDNYLDKIKLKDWIIFTILLSLVNSIKPNFVIAFAPTLLIFFIIDFFKNIKSKQKIKNIIIFGCSILVSLLVLVYQSYVLYGIGDGSGLTFQFLGILKDYHKYPIISIIQSAAFPLFILITNWKIIIKNRKYSFVYLMNLVGLAEQLCLNETGVRAYDGNFEWGYCFTLFFTFVCSTSILINYSKDKNIIYKIVGWTLLLLHFSAGIYYFIRLLLGYPFI